MALGIAFWLLALTGVAAALLVVSVRGVFRAALALVLCLLCVAGIYVTLSADFLAAVQILVYVGAISVLIILGIMLTKDVQKGSQLNRLSIPAFVVAAVLLGVIGYAVTATRWQVSGVAPMEPTTAGIGARLFGEGGLVLVVEIAGFLLLAAIVGAIVLGREK
ncbi:MAG: NADH-quinone oxidoreductase subunit J [Chloroflexota bacterium]